MANKKKNIEEELVEVENDIDFFIIDGDNVMPYEPYTLEEIIIPTLEKEEPLEEVVIEKKAEKKIDANKINILYAKVLYVNKTKNKTYLDCKGKEISVRGIYKSEYVELHYIGNFENKYEIISIE